LRGSREISSSEGMMHLECQSLAYARSSTVLGSIESLVSSTRSL
jgi:hypothetical protein